jgi:hypothetical protein
MWTHFPDRVTYRFTEVGGWNHRDLSRVQILATHAARADVRTSLDQW